MPVLEPQSSQARQGRIRLKTRANHGAGSVRGRGDTDRGNLFETLEVPGPYLRLNHGGKARLLLLRKKAGPQEVVSLKTLESSRQLPEELIPPM